MTLPASLTKSPAVKRRPNGEGVELSGPAGPTATAPTANAWSVGGFAAAPGQINGIQSVADIFRLTGVVVLAGLQAPTASQSALIMRPGEQELMMCQRYYYRRDHISGDWVSTLQAYTASLASGPLFAFPTRMRVSPTGLTVTPPPAFQLVTAAGVGLDANVSGVINTTPDAAYVSGVGIPTASLVAGNATLFTSKGSTHTFDARL